VNHMKEWFASQNDECPSGCGCNCRLATVLQTDCIPQGSLCITLPPVQIEQQAMHATS
jgi:hypothetical protein